MKLFLITLAVISLSQFNSMTALADQGAVCNEMKIRLQALKAMQAQDFIGIRFAGPTTTGCV